MKIIITISFSFLIFSSSLHSQLWKQYSDSAKIFSAKGSGSTAISYYLKALDEIKHGPQNDSGYASICYLLARLYENNRDEKNAAVFLLEALEAWKVSGRVETFEYMLASTDLGSYYWNMGKYVQAVDLYLGAKSIIEKFAKGDIEYASIINNLALLYTDMGKYELALPLYLEAKDIFGKKFGMQSAQYATACNNIADYYMEKGRFEKAEPLFIEAKDIREKALGKDHPAYAQSCNNLSDLYMDIGQYEKAELLLQEAKIIIEKSEGKNSYAYAQNCNNLASVYLVKKDYENAESFFLEATRIDEAVLGKDHPNYSINCSNLAGVYAEEFKYKQAESLLLEVKSIRERTLGKDHPAYAQSCNSLGCLYVDMENYKEAEPLLWEANRLYEKTLGSGHKYFANSCRNLVILYWKTNRASLARNLLDKAMKAQAKQLEQIFRFTSEREKEEFIQNVSDSYDTDQSFCFTKIPFQQAGISFDLSVENRNLILNSSSNMKKMVNNSSDTVLHKMYSKWISLREQLASMYSRPVSELKSEKNNMEEDAGKLEKQLARYSSEFARETMPQNSGWKDISRALAANEVAIEFTVFQYTDFKRQTDSIFYVALVLRKDFAQPILVPLFEKARIDSLTGLYADASANERVQSLYSNGHSLYDLVWKPLEKHLKGIGKIYYALSGELLKMSFAALPISVKEMLSDRYHLVQLHSTSSIISKEQGFVTAKDKIQVFGGIQYDAGEDDMKRSVSRYRSTDDELPPVPADGIRGSGFRFLPGTGSEAEEIKTQATNARVSVTVLSGINATEESFKALNGKLSPAIVHIATHGFFFADSKKNRDNTLFNNFEISGRAFKESQNPLLRSGLLFAGANNAWRGKPVEGIDDGIATAYEVSNMYLPATRLVVLSACETALGDIQGGEGVYGLQRAFKMAGVQNLVMSLWKVPDAETAEFMQLFYKNIFEGKIFSEAFYKTQTTMKNKYRSEPYKWAAWVLVR